MSSLKRITSHFSIAALFATFMVAIPTEGQPPAAVAAPNDSVCELPGYGLEDYPYLVDSSQDFEEIPDCDGAGVYFMQRLDVDFGQGWPDITQFEGHFNGNEMMIENLRIVSPSADELGLFGSVQSGASIRNVSINGALVEGNDYVGILAGRIAQDVTIDNIRLLDLSLEGSDDVGLLAGSSRSSISNVSIYEGFVESQGHVGGLVGTFFANGQTGEERNSLVLSNISIVDTTVSHPAGNNNTRMGALAGLLQRSVNGSVDLRDIAIHAYLEDAGTGTQAGALFGSQFTSVYEMFPVSVTNAVIEVTHEAMNPSEGRPFSLLGSNMDAISFDVTRVVATLTSDGVSQLGDPFATRTPKVVELLGGTNFSNGTTVSASEVYYDSGANPTFTFTNGATAKTDFELVQSDLYSTWSVTSDITDLFQQPDSHIWFQGNLVLPWLAHAVKLGDGESEKYFLSAPSVLARAGEFGVFDFVGPSIDASVQVRLEVRATNAADAQLISLRPPEANQWSTVSVLQDGTVRFEGTLEEVESDLKRHILDPTHTATQVDLTVELWLQAFQLLDESLSLPVLGCTLQGSGTAADPYLIQTQSDLSQVMACDDQGIFFEQTADIQMQRPHVPIGHDELRFQGIYDGGNFGITNLVNNNPLGSSQGLFGVVGDGDGTSSQTTIKNLSVQGSVHGNRNVGLLVGDVDDLKVSNVTLEGQVTGQSSVGLLAGDSEDLTAIGVVARGKAHGVRDEIGLVLGDGFDSDIWLEDIVIEGQVIGNEQLGALAGQLGDDFTRGLVRNVTAHVDVIALDRHGDSHIQERVGGLVGNSSLVPYTNVSVYGLEMPGKLGRVFIHDDPTQTNSGRHDIGGLIGFSDGDTFFDAHAEIDVVIEAPQDPDGQIGGMIGRAITVELLNSSFEGAVVGYDDVGGVIGKVYHFSSSSAAVIAEVTADAVVTGHGADVGGFAGNVNHGSSQSENVIIQDVVVSGSVTSTSGDTVGGFIGDIDLEENVSGDSAWQGRISISRSGSNMSVTGTSASYTGGFIGYLQPVSPLLIEDSFATGDVTAGSYAGGFIGEAYTGLDADANLTILRSFASGDVLSTGGNVGGFIGWQDASSDPGSTVIDQSYSTGDVTGDLDYVGGFIGELSGGVISNSYSTGNVLGGQYVGGFAGDINNDAEVSYSYSAGRVELSNPSNDVGHFTSNLLDASTLTSVGWNSDESGAEVYSQVNFEDEFEIESANWDSTSTYPGWDIAASASEGKATWVLCSGLSELGPMLWWQVRAAGGDCGSSQMPAIPQSLNTGGTPLDFNFVTDRGEPSAVGHSLSYFDIIDGSEHRVDAKLTVLDIQQVDYYSCSRPNSFDPPNNMIEELDSTSSDVAFNRWIRLQLEEICLGSQQDGYVEFKVEFFIDSNPVSLEQLSLDITDVDDRQFVEVEGFDRYSLSEDSILSARVVDGVTRIEETQDLSTSTTSTTSDFDFIGSALTVGRVQFEFDSASEIIIRAGASKNGAAYFDFDFSSGSEWVDTRGTVEVLTITNPVLEVAEVEAVTAAPYEGPVVFSVDPQSISQSGGEVSITGRNLESVSRIQVAGVDLLLDEVSAELISATVPAGLALGLQDAELTSDFGKLMIADLIRVVTEEDLGFAAWTSLKGDYVKVYAKNLVGVGKVQFMHNDKEIAWVRAVDQSNPKLRRANGFSYLVRSVDLLPGKNVFEIYVDGERVRRAAYTLR